MWLSSGAGRPRPSARREPRHRRRSRSQRSVEGLPCDPVSRGRPNRPSRPAQGQLKTPAGQTGAMGAIEDRLAELGLELPAPLAAPPGVTLPFAFVRVHGDLALHLRPWPARRRSDAWSSGRVGAEVSVEQAYDAARATGLSMLASLKQELGELDRVDRLDQGARLRQVRGGVRRHPGRDQRLQRPDPRALGRRRTSRPLGDRRQRVAVRHAGRGRGDRRDHANAAATLSSCRGSAPSGPR